MIVIEAGFTGTAQPLDHPRIGAFPVAGTVVASSAAAGYDAEFAASGDYKAWRPLAVPAQWDLTFPATEISYLGVVGNMGAVGATVRFQRWTGSIWVTMASITPASDDTTPVMCLTVARSLDRYRIEFTGGVPTVQAIFGGAVIELPQRAEYVGSVDFDVADTDSFRDNVSDGGQVLDRFITRRAVPAMMEVAHLSETYVQTVIKPLRKHLKTQPLFMASRPSKYPMSVAFGLLSEPLDLRRTIANKDVSTAVAFKVSGHAGA
jgi:hypothetical protein